MLSRRCSFSSISVLASKRLSSCRHDRRYITCTTSLLASHQLSAPSKTFVLPDNFTFQCGVKVKEVSLSHTNPIQVTYQTYGKLNADKSNVILYPTSYGAQHTDIDWLIRPNSRGILDPNQYYIIIPNMFGNGQSTSPSTNPELYRQRIGDGGDAFFYTTHYDNVRAQKLLLQDHLMGLPVENDMEDYYQKEPEFPPLAAIYGWSMGAQQAYHWGALYPHAVRRIIALCGTARTTPHNKLFLYSLRAALQADPTWNATQNRFEGIPDRGYHAFTQIYASWAASQPFYQKEIWKKLPAGNDYSSLEDYIARGWEANYRKRDPHNLLAMIETWMRCDLSHNPQYKGDYTKSLQSIEAKCLVMPGTTDLYFTIDDCREEANLIPDCEFMPIPSIWGHRAGNPNQNAEDEAFIRNAVELFLADNTSV